MPPRSTIPVLNGRHSLIFKGTIKNKKDQILMTKHQTNIYHCYEEIIIPKLLPKLLLQYTHLTYSANKNFFVFLKKAF